MNYIEKLINAIELLSPEDIKDCLENGVNNNDHFKNKPLIYELITGYARGAEFKECVKVFMEHDLAFEDKILSAVFIDDGNSLNVQLKDNQDAVNAKYTFGCAFTPLYEVSLLHICAEFNHLDCAKVLVKYGADINAKAGIDENGFGGQTPIFHTVNQNSNKCIDVMNYLIAQSADLTLTIKGLVWGKGYDWETFIPAINPISYAMMGLLPQFQRNERNVYEMVSVLLKAAYKIDYTPENLPNKYLNK